MAQQQNPNPGQDPSQPAPGQIPTPHDPVPDQPIDPTIPPLRDPNTEPGQPGRNPQDPGPGRDNPGPAQMGGPESGL